MKGHIGHRTVDPTSTKLRPYFRANRMPSIIETSLCFDDMSDLLPTRMRAAARKHKGAAAVVVAAEGAVEEMGNTVNNTYKGRDDT